MLTMWSLCHAIITSPSPCSQTPPFWFPSLISAPILPIMQLPQPPTSPRPLLQHPFPSALHLCLSPHAAKPFPPPWPPSGPGTSQTTPLEGVLQSLCAGQTGLGPPTPATSLPYWWLGALDFVLVCIGWKWWYWWGHISLVGWCAIMSAHVQCSSSRLLVWFFMAF